MKRILLPLLLAATAAGSVHAVPLTQAQVTGIHKDVQVLDASGSPRPAKENETIRQSNAVKTGSDSRAELVFQDKTLTRLGANTIFKFTEGTRDMQLAKGTMLLQVPKNAGGAKITTAAVTAAITGTTIMMEYSPPGGSASADKLFAQNALTPSVDPQAAGEPPLLPELNIATPPEIAAAPAPAISGPTVISATGTVESAPPGSTTFTQVQQGQVIPEGSTIRTANGGEATIEPVPGAAFKVGQATTVEITTATPSVDNKPSSVPKVALDLKQGSIFAAIGRKEGGKLDYKVKTPQGVAAAKGTVVGTIVQGNNSIVISLHSTVTFTPDGKPSFNIGGGTVQGFGPDGAQKLMSLSEAMNNPALRSAVMSLVAVIKEAVTQGILNSKLPGSVKDGLEKGGYKDGKTGSGGGVAGKGKGHVKILVLEGKLKVALNNKVGESMLIEPGQMMICDPNSRMLPATVTFNLDQLKATSALYNAFKAKENIDNEIVEKSADKQKKELEDGTLLETNAFVFGDQMIFGPDEKIREAIDKVTEVVDQREEQGDGFTEFGPLTTIEGDPYSIGDGTTVVTDPTITTNGVTSQGVLYNAAIQGPAANFFFGGRTALETSADFNNPGRFEEEISLRGTWAVFKFFDLEIVGNPTIDTSNGGALNLAFISENDINVFLDGGTFSPQVNTLMLGTIAGDIDISDTTIEGGSNKGLILLSHRGIGTKGGEGRVGPKFIDEGGETEVPLSGGGIFISNSNLYYPGGLIVIGAQDSLSFNNVSITAGVLDIFSPSSFTLSGSSLNLNVGQMSARAYDLTFNFASVPVSTIFLELEGTNSLTLNSGLSATNAQTVNLHAGSGGITSYGSLIGIKSLKTDGSIDVGGSITGPSLSIEAGGSISFSGTVDAKDIIAHDGPITGSSGGTLTATNSIETSGDINASGYSLKSKAITAGGDVNVYDILPVTTPAPFTYTITAGSVQAYGGINLSGTNDSPVLGDGNNLNMTVSSLSLGSGNTTGITLRGGDRSSTGKAFRGGNLDLTFTGSFSQLGNSFNVSGGNATNGDGGDGGLIKLEATTSGSTIGIYSSLALGALNANGGNGSQVGGKGGTITLLSKGDLNVGPYSVITAQGGAGNQGGDGGIVNLTSTTGKIKMDGLINAGTGQNNSVSYDGTGGTVNINANTVDISGDIIASRAEPDPMNNVAPQVAAKNGGNVQVLAHNTTPGVTAINVSNSSEILAMINSASTGTGGKIKFVADGGTISVNGKVVAKTEVTIQTPHLVDIGSSAILHAESLKIGAIGSGGQLILNGGSQLSGDDTVFLFAGGTSGILIQGGDVTVSNAAQFVVNSPALTVANGSNLNVTGIPVLNLNIGSQGTMDATRRWAPYSSYGGFTANGAAIPRTDVTSSNIGGAAVTLRPFNSAVAFPNFPALVGP